MTARVLIAGYYGAGNAGDEAVLTAMLQDMRALRADLEFTVVSASPTETAARHRVRSIGGSDVAAIVDAAGECDAIILGGGGIFHDYWGCDPDAMLTPRHAGIPFYAGFPFLAALTGRPCMIYAVGVGPLYSDEAKRLTREAFEQASVATVRDDASRDLLQKIGVAGTGIAVTADPAFGLRPDPERARLLLSRMYPDRSAPLIAVCPRSWTVDGSPGEWERHIAQSLDRVIERTGAFVLFVPFQAVTRYFLTDDVAAADRVRDRMMRADRAAVLRDGDTPEALAGVLARCDLVVGMRLHSLVLAASAGVPAVGITYDPKVSSLMTRLGLGEYAVALDATSGLADRVSRAWEHRNAIHAALAAAGAQLRELSTANAALALGLLDRHRARPAHAPWPASLGGFALAKTRQLAEQQALAEQLSTQLAAQSQKLAAVSAQADALAAQVAALTGSLAWRAAEALRPARRRLAPPGSRRERVFRAGVRLGMAIAQRGLGSSASASGRRLLAAARQWLARPRGPWALEYREESCAAVTLYTDRSDLFPDYRPRKPLSGPRPRRIDVSLITTVRNERSSVPGWIASLAAQTRLPDEVVIVDAGSTDGTAEALEAARLGIAVTVMVEPGANIARGRNLAIARARGRVLAATDLGCRLTPAWLDRIVAPFELDPSTQVAAGWYVALEQGRLLRRRRWPTLDQVAPGDFLPSSRSIAFTREAWAAVDGYPEWLTLTGEDTWFALELRRFCERWAFVPGAVVEWHAPPTMVEYWRKIHAWSAGDGESGIAARHYWRSFRRVAAASACGALAAGAAAAATGPALVLLAGSGLIAAAIVQRQRKALGSLRAVAWESGAEAARVIGFLRGARRRPEIAARRHRGERGMAFILSGVPIDDTGGGARCSQLALELLKQGWYVVFLSRFPRYESKDLELKIRHPRLLNAALGDFAWRRFIRDRRRLFRQRGVMAIVEFPIAEFVPVARAVRKAGGSVVYDLLDKWDSALGGHWYSPAVERRIIALSDVLVATAASLVSRLEQMSGREVALLPNAVNTDLFDEGRRSPRPADYPAAPWSMIYIGALWGDWFDWDLLRRLAVAYSEAAVVVVGDYRGQMASPPDNIHFLGLKAQADLPGYLAQADVAIIPWKVNAVTHATSPLKVYEYIAMRRPVVAPRLDALEGIPGVLLSRDVDDFVRNVGRARGAPLSRAVVDGFVRENSWPARVRTLIELVARVNPRVAAGSSDPRRSSRGAAAGVGKVLEAERS